MIPRTGGLTKANSKMKKLLAVSAAAALLAGVALVTPAWASLTGPDSVRPGKNVTVFHNSDFVAVFGYPVGQKLTVDVYRGQHKIATAFGLAVNTPEGGGLEVNHGPVGAARQGDCWERFTPDILSGDRIVVTDPAGTDEVIVDGITIDSGPAEITPDPNNPPPNGAQAGDVVLEGRATFAGGAPIDIAQLEASSEFRQDAPRLLISPTDIVATDNNGGWRAIYRQPYSISRNRDNLSANEQKQALLNTANNHSIGYGHVVPLPTETQLAETVPGGPALGCDVPTSPFFAPRQDNALATSSDPAINLTSGPITFGGTAAEEVESVTLTLSDGTTTVESTNVGITGGPSKKGWSGEFTREPDQLGALANGPLTARAVFNLPGGVIAGESTMQIVKDTEPPGLATANPVSGIYNVTRLVALSPPAGETGASIRYTTGAAPADPTETVGQTYSGAIQVAESTKIKARVFDAAGNPGEVATFDYTIDGVAPSLSANLATGSYNGTQSFTLTSADPDAKIYYTNNGSTPSNSSTAYSGAIPVSSTTTIKAVAIDPAGNASPVVERKITIRTATNTSLNTATTTLKLGTTRTISGLVRPAQPSGKVTLTIRKPGFDVVRTLNLVNSRYSFRYRPPVLGSYTVQVSFVQDADSLASKSVTKTFRVIR